MIKSMTGFGRGKYENDSREYAVEIKSVNNRYCDISVKLPRSISYLEEKVKAVITNSVARGKIDIFITFVNNSDKGKNITINSELAKKYIDQIKFLADTTQINNNINVMEITKLPDVLNITAEENEGETIWQELQISLNSAVENFMQMRKAEGQKIKEDLETRIDTISKKIDKIKGLSTGLVEEYIVKLEKRINELLKSTPVDQARLAQEIVIYSDKCSVEEELTRLGSHICQFLGLLKMDSPIGKKLDFLVQEMNRETNTIGSKANNIEITNLVIDVKTEVENVREQIQNIE